MTRFNRLAEAYLWVARFAQGAVCVIQSNQRIEMNPWCRGDMRLLETEVCGEWK